MSVVVPRVIRTVAPRVTVTLVEPEPTEPGERAARRYMGAANRLDALATEEARDATVHRAAGRPSAGDEADERSALHHRLARSLRRAAALEQKPWEPLA